jgi:hypothetical protein
VTLIPGVCAIRRVLAVILIIGYRCMKSGVFMIPPLQSRMESCSPGYFLFPALVYLAARANMMYISVPGQEKMR